mmetsp:Transcript_3717/g.8419  ORF Transcript_3717/g.8419 Transcript_3717/m.8419 type:complete len:803 (+) Transcript_3717:139-2547(+)
MITARRLFHSQKAFLRSRPGAAITSIDGSKNNDAETTRTIISHRPILLNRCSSNRPVSSIERDEKYKLGRSFSTSQSIEAVSSPSEDTISRGSLNDVDNPADASRTPRRRRKSYNQSPTGDDSTKTAEESTSSLTPSPPECLPPLTQEEYDPEEIIKQIHLAAKFDQGKLPGQSNSNIRGNRRHNQRKWDHELVRKTVDDYERHLQYVLSHLQSSKKEDKSPSPPSSSNADAGDVFSDIDPNPKKSISTHRLLAPPVLSKAIRALTRSRMDTPVLSTRVRDMERLVGQIGWTPITEELSYRLLEANGKAGNVRRTLALLELRRKRGYAPREQDVRPTSNKTEDEEEEEDLQNNNLIANRHNIAPGEKEFVHALTSISSAQLPLRRTRNIYLHESSLSPSTLNNPTNYLDAILINMSRRNVPLTPAMAARMLGCYASTGRTARALHYFYKVVRDPIEDDGYYIPGPHPTSAGRIELEEWKERKRQEGAGRVVVTGFEREEDDGAASDDGNDSITMKPSGMPLLSEMTKTRMIMHPPPPFHKIPSAVKGQNLSDPYSFGGMVEDPSSSSSPPFENQHHGKRTKYEWEIDREYSLALTAAFAFADSLTHGACGHDPIELDVVGWNCLIKACCHRGAFHRALKILNETMPQRGIEPDSYSYNTLLAGFARVGDIASLKEYLIRMTNKRVPVTKYTAQAMADGFLNVGDVSGASSMVQDIFNQHDTLPPYTTHLKIIEFALSNGLIFEAKRHVYFVQQLWKWQPSQHHDKQFCKIVDATKRNPKLSKKALQKLFRYFHEELNDKDFF